MTLNVHLIDLPIGVKETVCRNEDDSYSIFLNARCNYETHLKSYQHALSHIKENDFEKDDVQSIESRCQNEL